MVNTPFSLTPYGKTDSYLDALGYEFFEPVREAGLMSVRFLMNFLGIKRDWRHVLNPLDQSIYTAKTNPRVLVSDKNQNGKRARDIAIELWNVEQVGVDEAIAFCLLQDFWPENIAEADRESFCEVSISLLLQFADIGVAHAKNERFESRTPLDVYEIGTFCIEGLIDHFFYKRALTNASLEKAISFYQNGLREVTLRNDPDNELLKRPDWPSF